MSVESMAWALNLVDERLNPTQKFTLVGICNHDGDGGAWPSIATLARYVRTTERSVQRSISHLVDLGYIEVGVQAGGTASMKAQYRPNLYRIIRNPGVSEATPLDFPGRADAPTLGVTLASPLDEPGVTLASPLGVTLVSPEPSIEPSMKENPPICPPLALVPPIPHDPFEVWWKRYPRHVGKQPARKAWNAALKRGVSVPELLERTDAQIQVWEIEKCEERFIPHPATWLNQERYNDEMRPVRASTKGSRSLEAIRRVTEAMK